MKFYKRHTLLFLLLNLSLIAKGLGITSSINFASLTYSPEDTAQLNSYARQAMQYSINKANVETVKSIINKANNYAELNKVEATPLLHLAKAELFYYFKDFKNASEEAQEALKSAKTSNDYKVMALTQNFLGVYCTFNGFFKQSQEFFENAIKIAEGKKLKGIIPKAYEGLANLSIALNNNSEALRMLQLMLESSIAENSTLLMQTAYLRLGEVKMNYAKDYQQANDYYQKSLDLSRKLGDSTKIAFVLSRIAWNYYLKNELDTSLKYYLALTNIYSQLHNLVGLANSYGNIGTIFRDKKDNDKALFYYKKGIDKAIETKNWYNLSWIYKDMSDMYSFSSNYKNAYNYYVLYKQYNDSLINSNFNSGLADARVKYEADTKEKELELLSLKLKNQKLLLYGFIGFLLLITLIGLLLIRQSKLNAKRKISEMNQKISEITQANLRQQMNPHFIFNTLNSIQYYMYQHDKLATNNYLTKFSSLMRRILENSQHTAIPLSDELDAVKLYLELESIRFKNKFDYEITIDDEIDTLLYKVPTMLIQPYVENAICHGLVNKEEKGYLKIGLYLKENYLACIIEDNGIGREAAMEIKKKREKNHNSLGTKITESRLDLVNLLYGTSLKIEYTDLKDETDRPSGTRVEIQIPILT